MSHLLRNRTTLVKLYASDSLKKNMLSVGQGYQFIQTMVDRGGFKKPV